MSQRLKVQYWPLAKLREAPDNARTHSAEQVAQLARSLDQWGWTNPLLVDEEGELIAGHGRLAAAKLRGLREVPVIVLAGLTEAQRRAYRVADNRLAENAGWDDDKLAAVMKDLRALDFDLSAIGFDDDELAELLEPDDADTPREGNTDGEAAPPPAPPVSRAGDLWLLGPHRLLCGSAIAAADVARAIGPLQPNLMVTDPPYGVEYDPAWRDGAVISGVVKVARAQGAVQNDDRADWREAWTLFPGPIAYVWHAGVRAGEVQASLEAAGFEVRAQVIWAKHHFPISRGHYHWKHEPCWYAVRKGRDGNWQGDRKQTTLWEIENRNPVGATGADADDAKTDHGTQKPLECMRKPMVNHTVQGDAVLDPFMGSATTLIAAEQLGRVAIGLEIDPVYVDMAVKRWQDFTGVAATLADDGRTFAEIAAARAEQPPLLAFIETAAEPHAAPPAADAAAA